MRYLFLICYWFDPVVWLAVKRICQDSEFSCDERAVSMFGEEAREAYGDEKYEKEYMERVQGALRMSGMEELLEKIREVDWNTVRTEMESETGSRFDLKI